MLANTDSQLPTGLVCVLIGGAPVTRPLMHAFAVDLAYMPAGWLML